MARGDLLLDLVEAERRGDRGRFRVVVEGMIAEERANQHHLLADRLSEIIMTTGQGLPRDDQAASVRDLVQEVIPRRRLDELELDPVAQRVVSELIEEQHAPISYEVTGESPATVSCSPALLVTARPVLLR